MDFGDILDKWDEVKSLDARQSAAKAQHSGKKPSSKKPNAPSRPRADGAKASLSPAVQTAPHSAVSKDIRAIQEEWLHQHITFDKDAISEEESKRSAEHSVRYIKAMPSDARLDLHGYTQREAWTRLSDFIDECMRRGARKVLIIHGKGIHTADSEGVLSALVQDFIEADSRLGQSGHPDRKHGGRGATWVIIKR